MPERIGLREVIERLILIVAIATLLLVAGMLLARYNKFPYPLVNDAIKGAGAAAVQLGWIADTDTGTEASDGERSSLETGVTRYDPALADEGFTLITAGSAEEAVLLDMNGRTVHRWQLPVSVLRERQENGNTLPDVSYSWRSFHMDPNGDLLVVLQGSKVTPYGRAIFKLNKDSELLWANLDYAHHDVVVGEDGLIYTISQEIRKTPIPELESLDPPFLEDFVLVLSPDGETVHRLSVMKGFSGTPFASAVQKLAKARDWKGDYFHVNAIEPYDSRNEIAVVRKNQVLISVRNMDALATLDLGSGKIVWLWRGSWHRQHDPDFTNGRIMLFDNRGDFSRGSRSRVLEFDPQSEGLTWQVGANAQYDLYSGWGAGQQVLANGNVLINESVPARLLEVTRNGDVAWEFYGALRDGSGKFAAPILEARRYPASYIDFQFGGG